MAANKTNKEEKIEYRITNIEQGMMKERKKGISNNGYRIKNVEVWIKRKKIMILKRD